MSEETKLNEQVVVDALNQAATVREVADKYQLSVSYVLGIAHRTPILEPARVTSTNQVPIDLGFLVWDDDSHDSIWGLRPKQMEIQQKIDLDTVYDRFHGAKHVCEICGSSQKLKMLFLDAEPRNFLISNMVRVCHECFVKRFTKTTIMRVSKEFEMHSCHRLFNYTGLCQHPHGHTYKLVITIEKPLDRITGMVEDFSTISYKVKKWVISALDHNDINTVIPGMTTAEIMALWIWKVLAQVALVKGLLKVELYETATSKTEVTAADVQALIMGYMEAFTKQGSSLVH